MCFCFVFLIWHHTLSPPRIIQLPSSGFNYFFSYRPLFWVTFLKYISIMAGEGVRWLWRAAGCSNLQGCGAALNETSTEAISSPAAALVLRQELTALRPLTISWRLHCIITLLSLSNNWVTVKAVITVQREWYCSVFVLASVTSSSLPHCSH